MGLTRRNFLQQAGFALLALGPDKPLTDVSKLAASPEKSYLQALQSANGRKLALLVGIDRYPYSKNLSGCTTDVELQRELLVQRFGFAPSDVLVLTDQQATREEIETAFVEHLIEQAKANDAVVFHFSGYGSCVKIPSIGEKEQSSERQVKSLLPFDGLIPTKNEPAHNDVLLETLAILAQSLETQQVTFVLDTSYRRTGQLLRGNLRSRSPLIPMAERPGPQELAFQEQLKGRSSRARQPSVRGIPPGALLLAAADTQMAAEGQWSGFSAGLFTYALVQHLWQATPPATLYVSLARASERMGQWSAQRPQLQTSKQLKAPPLTYFVPPMAVRGAEGVAIALEDDRSTFVLHLAGLPPTVLEYYQPNSRLSLSLENGTESEPEEIVQLQIRSREGLRATAKLVGEGLPEGFQFQPRLLARERIRILPRHVGLRIALGADLERIERVDATSAFSNIAVVSSIASAGEQGADCLFAKSLKSVAPSESGDEESAKAAPETASRGYELFSIGRVSLPNTAGSPGEAIALAVERLTPKLKTLLAVKLLRLTLNEGSSHLKARARLVALEPVPKIAIERAALRSQHVLPVDKNASETSSSNSAVQTLAPHSRIQYVVENGGEHSLYVALLGLDPLGRAIALYAPKADGDVATLTQIECQPGTSLTIPHKVNSDWRVADAPGWAEMYLIVSRSPLTQTLKALSNCGSYSRSAGEQLQEAHNPLDVARSLLQDLHEASTVSPEVLGSASEVYAFDVKAWATFSFIYQVVQG